jgi:phage terminase Nu1 subunit (DNA packaging protein)
MEKIKLNRNELAELFEVARTTVDKWVREGLPSAGGGKGTQRLFDLKTVVQWQINRASDQGGEYSELLLKEKYRALKRQNDIEEKEVAPVSLITEALEKSANVIIPILESLPLILKRNWPEITGDQTMLVKKSIAECRNAIADMKVDLD